MYLAWAKYGCEPMSKKEPIVYCNKVWPRHTLASEEQGPPHDCVRYDTILPL